MEGGKDLLHQAGLFAVGKVLGNVAGIVLFSVILSLVLNKLNFNPNMFMIIFFSALLFHLVIRSMVKERWL